jgi:hypothetical protein
MLWICCNESPIKWRWNFPCFNSFIFRACCNIICVCICIEGRLFDSTDCIRVSLKWINKRQRRRIVYFYLAISINNDNCGLFTFFYLCFLKKFFEIVNYILKIKREYFKILLNLTLLVVEVVVVCVEYCANSWLNINKNESVSIFIFFFSSINKNEYNLSFVFYQKISSIRSIKITKIQKATGKNSNHDFSQKYP